MMQLFKKLKLLKQK